jgi:hypothetical protein
MTDADFDKALISAAFAIAGREGWTRMDVAAAAREAGLPLDRARARFPARAAVLMRFGVIADQAAIGETAAEGPVRDRLFDMIMRRIDVLQAHRAGMLALLRHLPADPPAALLLTLLSRRSMDWLLAAAGVSTHGVRGMLRVKGLLAVWLWTVRAWQRDESEDLGPTMAALDTALQRAERAAGWLQGRTSRPAPPPPDPEPELPLELPLTD